MSEVIYILCAIASTACAVMLWRGYRKSRTQLLLWSSLCFLFLAGNNIILFVDLVVIPQIEFAGIIWRNGCGALAGIVLLYGLIWELT